jgi:hypothetical protein
VAPKRPGPYLECTYKVHNRTVNLKLYPEVAPLAASREICNSIEKSAPAEVVRSRRALITTPGLAPRGACIPLRQSRLCGARTPRVNSDYWVGGC